MRAVTPRNIYERYNIWTHIWQMLYVCSDVTSVICILWCYICHMCVQMLHLSYVFLWCYFSNVQMLHLSYVCSDVKSVLCMFRCYICPMYVQMLHLSNIFCDVTFLMFRCYICHMYVQMLHLSYVCSDITYTVTSELGWLVSYVFVMWHFSCSDVTSVIWCSDITCVHTQWDLNWAGLCMCVCVCVVYQPVLEGLQVQ